MRESRESVLMASYRKLSSTFFWLTIVLTISLILLLIDKQNIVFVESKLSYEFTLDELTNGDSSYQPLSFANLHNNNNLRQQPVQRSFLNNGVPMGIGAGDLQQEHAKNVHISQGGDGGSSEQHRHRDHRLLDGLANNRLSQSSKRAGERKTCHPTKPFLCPSDDPQTGECIPIQYLCDGSSDCPPYSNSPGGYDEDPLLCTAVKRPPVEETANFLRTLITNHGPEYIEKLFGAKMSQALMPLGGPERVAIALSVSKTIEDFGKALHLMRGDIDHLRNVLVAVQTADGPMLKNLGIVRNSELADMKFFLEKLLSTGFLD